MYTERQKSMVAKPPEAMLPFCKISELIRWVGCVRIVFVLKSKAYDERHICDGLFTTNVGQGALVGVVEGEHLLGLGKLGAKLLHLVRVGQHSGIFKGSLNAASLSELVELSGDVAALLAGHLGGGGVGGLCAVAHGPDVIGTEHLEVVVDSQAATLLLRSAEVSHELASDLASGVAGSPDEEAVGNFDGVLVGVESLECGFSDVLDHGACHDGDFVAAEVVVGIVTVGHLASQYRLFATQVKGILIIDVLTSIAANIRMVQSHYDPIQAKSEKRTLLNIGRTEGRASTKVILMRPAISGYH